MMTEERAIIDRLANASYPYGEGDAIAMETLPPGLSEHVVRTLSAMREEPSWMLDLRLQAYAHWQSLSPPEWWNVQLSPIDYQSISYHSRPMAAKKAAELKDVDP